ncbi:hypothetical protein LSUE1_G009358 [Lachnellula suecica]|uniref:Rhodopsin domain-containing protein n=1 Tax=Lachnellula suecica TaxID=602035 RepID=A0A8T9C2F2_9HELO|nr:hypothetical protein LSUE1_G009358 [Lachnellula suecica]
MVYDLSVPMARDPLIAITTSTVIAIITVVLRHLDRRMRRRKFGLEDGFMLGAIVLLVASVGLFYTCVIVSGVGRHTAQLVNPNLAGAKQLEKFLLVYNTLCSSNLAFLKISIVCFYIRIFGDSKKFRIQAYVLIAILVFWLFGGLLQSVILCKPFAYNWDFTIPGGHCGNRELAYISMAGANVATDFLTTALPVCQVIHLKLPIKKKIAVVSMFSLGIFITIISILRIQSIRTINLEDFTYDTAISILWLSLESCLGMIAANLPMTRTFFVTVAPSIFGSSIPRTQSGTFYYPPSIGTRSWRGRNSDNVADIEAGEGFSSLQKARTDRGGSIHGLNSMASNRSDEDSVVGASASLTSEVREHSSYSGGTEHQWDR